MDEALAEAAVDISGRPFLAWNVEFERSKMGEMDTELFEEFFRAFAINALITLHVTRRAGHNAHHVAEACFKATARALRWRRSLTRGRAMPFPRRRARFEVLDGACPRRSRAGAGAGRLQLGCALLRLDLAAGCIGRGSRRCCYSPPG